MRSMLAHPDEPTRCRDRRTAFLPTAPIGAAPTGPRPMRSGARHRSPERGDRRGEPHRVQSLPTDRPPIRCRRPEPRPMRSGARHRRPGPGRPPRPFGRIVQELPTDRPPIGTGARNEAGLLSVRRPGTPADVESKARRRIGGPGRGGPLSVLRQPAMRTRACHWSREQGRPRSVADRFKRWRRMGRGSATGTRACGSAPRNDTTPISSDN